MKPYMIACALAVAAASAACVGIENKTTITSPSSTGVAALMGTWASATSSTIPAASTCTDFKWNATEQTSTTAKGSFSANCAGGLKVQGMAAGTLTGSTVAWSANGTATAGDLPSCAISLTGTAELGLDSIRVPYSGTTCLGPVSGVEILARK